MLSRFRSFVIFAEMRTGSNRLEEILNSVPGVACHGEAFNPHFMGAEGRDSLLGISLEERSRNPGGLLQAISSRQGLNGFRFFHDHDPRVVDSVVKDTACAKIILTRNPVDSYLSLKIARGTGQWKLTNPAHRKTAAAKIDVPEFAGRLEAVGAFSQRILHALQVTGQAAFHLNYEDLADIDVLNGLLAFLGLDHRLTEIGTGLIAQNPGPAVDKVSDARALDEIARHLARNEIAASRWPEPRRGPGVKGFVVARGAPVLFAPIPGGPNDRVEAWLESLGSGGTDRIADRASLRDWMRQRPGFVTLTAVRHPARRALMAWQSLARATDTMRATLARLYGVEPPDPDLPSATGLANFLRFLRENLDGRTALAINPLWASQASHLAAINTAVFPELVLREDRMEADLQQTAARLGVTAKPAAGPDRIAHDLARIWSGDLEKLAHAAYRRDYVAFGFGPWVPPQAA